MTRFTDIRWVAALTLAIALAPGAASAQEDDTLSITGTCKLSWYNDAPGGDLLGVLFNGNDHEWRLTLSGVSYSHDYSFWESGEVYITRVHATSFTFEFFGPDAAILNEVVSSQLTQGGLGFSNEFWVDSDGWPHSQGFWGLRLNPPNLAPGVSFEVFGYSPEFPADENGYPLIQPQRLEGATSVIDDYRGGELWGGELGGINEIVDIGSAEPPYVPPTLAILDASALEGHKGATNLMMTVKRSGDSGNTVTVSYRTVDGTAKAKEDYTATSGTLTFQPGETSRTIRVSIKGDRKREPNEAFSVQLSNAVGATIEDGNATITILNDD
jgi:hypothetical protein